MRGVQGLLLVATFVSMAYSGGTYWDVPPHLRDHLTFLPVSAADFWMRCRFGLPFAGWLFAIMSAHEMGHYVACRIYRIHATWPYFLPAPLFWFGTFGAVIRIHARIPDRRALFDVAFAGPFAGFVVTVAALAVGFLQAEVAPEELVSSPGRVYSFSFLGGWVADLLRPGETLLMNGTLGAAWGGFLITVLNLFPAGQLDGGHITYALSRKLHRIASYAAIGIAVVAVIRAVVEGHPPAYLLWVAILFWVRDRHPPLLAEHSRLGGVRVVLAFVALAMFVLCFTWFPLRYVE